MSTDLWAGVAPHVASRKTAAGGLAEWYAVGWDGGDLSGTVIDYDNNRVLVVPWDGGDGIWIHKDRITSTGEPFDPNGPAPQHPRSASRRTAMPAPADLGVQVGDIFYNSWGYDQTNVDFYEVIRLTGQGVEVQPIVSRDVSNGDGPHKSVVPVPGMVREWDTILGIERGSDKRSRVCRLKDGYRGTPTIVLKSGQYWASKWDGRPLYETGYGFGH